MMSVKQPTFDEIYNLVEKILKEKEKENCGIEACCTTLLRTLHLLLELC